MTNEKAIKELESCRMWAWGYDKSLKAAISALKKLSEIENIISCPLPIQEDVMRYKAICEVVKK